MTRAKVCGITNREDLAAAVDAGADAVGVITDVHVDTPREVEPSTAADLVAAAPPLVSTVLVTIPESAGRAIELAGAIKPDAVQVYSEFEPSDLRFIRTETGAKVIPALDYDDRERALDYDGVADAILVDSTEDGAGGTGRTGDWVATRELVADLDTPVILAGGLTPDNVADAVEAVDPYGVDVASGVEAEGGRKDHDAVRAFVRNARSAGLAVETDGGTDGDTAENSADRSGGER
jgi:phosphoribosylanthranilate isomerase